jgi:hypothetical protein
MEFMDEFIAFVKKENELLAGKFQKGNIKPQEMESNFRLNFYPKNCQITLNELNELQSLWEDFVHLKVPGADVHPLLVDGKVEPVFSFTLNI